MFLFLEECNIGVFRVQSNIYKGFFANMANNGFQLLIILAKATFLDWVLFENRCSFNFGRF